MLSTRHRISLAAVRFSKSRGGNQNGTRGEGGVRGGVSGGGAVFCAPSKDKIFLALSFSEERVPYVFGDDADPNIADSPCIYNTAGGDVSAHGTGDVQVSL